MVWVEISYSGIWHIHFLLPCCNIQNIVHSAENQHLHQQTSCKSQSAAAGVFEEGEIPIWEIYHVLFVISILLLPDPLRFLNQAKFHNWNLWPVSRKMNPLQKWQKRPFLGLATVLQNLPCWYFSYSHLSLLLPCIVNWKVDIDKEKPTPSLTHDSCSVFSSIYLSVYFPQTGGNSGS